MKEKKISEGQTAPLTISVDTSLHSSLRWQEAVALAQQAVELGRPLIWKLDFQIGSQKNSAIDQPLFLNSCLLAIEEFDKQLYQPYKKNVQGLILYDGPASFDGMLTFSPNMAEPFLRWLCDYQKRLEELGRGVAEGWSAEPIEDIATAPLPLRQLYRFFCRDQFVAFLSSFLPYIDDECVPQIVVHTDKELSAGEIAQLFNNASFEHFHVTLPPLPFGVNSDEDASLAICVPPLFASLPEDVDALTSVIEKMIRQKQPFRLVPESLMPYLWDGIDEMVVFHNALTPQGRRSLLGFQAAGGTVKEAAEGTR
ncbi:hypothetical protein JYU14_05205 [Simkania negevensis]|uniref:Uncharacterized protein n=1 Tax=Simkania negevensis TaxID=83561 RepID=A0ABS3AV47_9BACT|nr:hypothetical protein [Simkania negevensis]